MELIRRGHFLVGGPHVAKHFAQTIQPVAGDRGENIFPKSGVLLEDDAGTYGSPKTLLAELGGFCDDDAPVCLASFTLPGSPGKRCNTEPPDRTLYGNSLCNPVAGLDQETGSRKSLVSQQSKSRYSVNRQISSLSRSASQGLPARCWPTLLSWGARLIEGVNPHECPSSFSAHMRGSLSLFSILLRRFGQCTAK